jgi:hypothetical protein
MIDIIETVKELINTKSWYGTAIYLI